MNGYSSIVRYAMAASLAAIAMFFSVNASAVPARPEPPRLVNDLSGTLTTEQVEELEQRLVAYNDSTSTQIAVLMVGDLEGQDASSYAIETHQAWQVGSKENDNGVLILVKPKNDNGGGEVFISIGYGLEGAIPDATAKRIINEIMIPHFIENDYYGAIKGACDMIIRLADGEGFVGDGGEEGSGEGSAWGTGLGLLVLGVLLYFIFGRGKKGGGGTPSGNNNDYSRAARTASTILSAGSMLGGLSGGRSGGSGSRGGFGGFGGGSTGGAGAGGKW